MIGSVRNCVMRIASLSVNKALAIRKARRVRLWRSYFVNDQLKLLSQYSKDHESEAAAPLTDEERQRLRELWSGIVDENPQEDYYRLMRFVNSGRFDPHYISDELWYEHFLPALQPLEGCILFDDKSLYGFYFHDVNRPYEVVRNIRGTFYSNENVIVDEGMALDLVLDEKGPILVKPMADSLCGRGIKIIHPTSKKDVKAVFEEYGRDYGIQRLIRQSQSTAVLNKSSVNRFRITTLLLNGSFSVLSSVLGVGGAGKIVDNVGSGGFVVGVEDDGRLKPYGYGSSAIIDRSYDGKRLDEYQIRCFERVREFAERLHRRLPFVAVIGWDIALDERDEPILIEVNATSPGILYEQMCTGPLFSSRFDEVLQYVKSVKNAGVVKVRREGLGSWRADYSLDR